MLVRVNFGWKAGQIQDIEPVAARDMLADGRASKVDYETGEGSKTEGVAQLIPPASVEAQVAAAKEKKKR
jgi:hypothetical protein